MEKLLSFYGISKVEEAFLKTNFCKLSRTLNYNLEFYIKHMLLNYWLVYKMCKEDANFGE